MNDDDDNSRLGMWIALGAALLVALGTVLTLVWSSAEDEAQALAAAKAKPVVDLDATLDIPLTGDLLGKVFFDLGKADVSVDATGAIDKTVDLINAAPTRKVVLSGFHDLSGDPAQNAELAKNRAKAVREVLKARGLAPERVLLRKPAETGAGGPPEEARRVEIRLID
jgi:outer membrane protein OmpA-like peptidoglycan-associated protein